MKDASTKFWTWLNTLTPGHAWLLAIPYVLLVFALDYAFPPQANFGLFYLVGTAFLGWCSGTRNALLLAVGSLGLLYWHDRSRANPLPPISWIFFWNTTVRAALFAATAWLASKTGQRTREQERKARETAIEWKAEAERHRSTFSELAEAVERFGQVINNIAEVFWLTDVSKNQMIYISPGYERIWGRPCEALYKNPQSWLEAIHPEDRAEVSRRAQTDQTSNAYDVEYRIIWPNGTIRWIRDRAFPVRNASGEVYRVAGVAEDITERKRVNAALQESEARLRAAIHSAPIVLFAIDETGVITFEDGQALPALRSGPSTNVGRSAYEVYSDYPQVLENLQRALRGEEFNSIVTLGEVSLDCWYLPVRGKDGKVTGVTGVATNISERLRLERQILEITDREQARIGQDLHDGLCQELVSLAFEANSLHRELAKQNRPMAARVEQIAEHLDHAITEARQVSRGLFPIRMEGEGLASALEELADTVCERFEIDCNFESSEPIAMPSEAIATHLYRIAQEAVNNAVKHSQARHLNIVLRSREGKIQILIEDDGRGFPAEANSDSGMGLHIMHYRARTIGATLSVRARDLGGTVVSCSLPQQKIVQRP